MLILDLCAGTGAWSKPYRKAGYRVIEVDLPRDVRLLEFDPGINVHGILAAPPCTVFSYARNRYPPSDEEIIDSLSVFDACLRAVILYKPTWWALENPVNKVRRYLGEPRFTFKQYEFGEPRTKPTGIWGKFKLPKKGILAQRIRSTWKSSQENALPKDGITPEGFARAFFEANP